MHNLLNSITNFNKKSLQECETVEKKVVEVHQAPTPKGKGGYSYNFGHNDDEGKIEWFEEPAKLVAKAKKLANLIKNSKHVVIYTGAGISTAAKLPDYRGVDGMWTNRDQGTQSEKTYTTISEALPTYSHLALAELVKRGLVKFVISTNVDGLHMRSGLDRNVNLTELHGNSYLEVCNKCQASYLRTKDVLQYQTSDHRVVNRHWCGGHCEKEGCDGILLDTIVAFGENLPEDQLKLSIKQSKMGDLAIVLGSTMMVQPACILPSYIYTKKGGKMIICNLQATPYDDDAEFLVRGYIDDLFYLVLQELEITLPTVYKIDNGSEFSINYEYRVDSVYPPKLAEAKRQYDEIQLEKKQSIQKGNAITRGDNPYQRSVISGTNENSEIFFKTMELAFFTNCKDSTYKIQDKTKKIVFENCHNCQIEINGKIITNVIEIINSSNVHFVINTSVFTITCDNCQNVDITFSNPEYFEMIAWAKVENPALKVGEATANLEIFEKINIDQDQVITKRVSGEIVSSVTRRDGCGRITELVPK